VRYRIVHQTEYFYPERVPLCHNVIRLRPRDTAFQTCDQHELSITPMPADRRERVDFFGNYATWIAIQEPHHSLKIDVTSEVDVESSSPPEDLKGPAWDEVPRLISNSLDPDSLAAREYTFDSPQVARAAELEAYARQDFPPGAPLLQCIMNLTYRIYDEFIFDTGATTIGTPILEVLEHRHGVCQDFAHLEIGCLRSLGLAARYVSGYVMTKPPPGQRRMVGADASHAWVSAFIPGYGWVDFDPTNGVIPSDEHITIGWARDYDDLSPVKGVIIGGHSHALSFSVDVQQIVPKSGDITGAVETSA
jgi:transglutaminase-like putative cysteine protease